VVLVAVVVAAVVLVVVVVVAGAVVVVVVVEVEVGVVGVGEMVVVGVAGKWRVCALHAVMDLHPVPQPMQDRIASFAHLMIYVPSSL